VGLVVIVGSIRVVKLGLMGFPEASLGLGWEIELHLAYQFFFD